MCPDPCWPRSPAGLTLLRATPSDGKANVDLLNLHDELLKEVRNRNIKSECKRHLARATTGWSLGARIYDALVHCGRVYAQSDV